MSRLFAYLVSAAVCWSGCQWFGAFEHTVSTVEASTVDATAADATATDATPTDTKLDGPAKKPWIWRSTFPVRSQTQAPLSEPAAVAVDSAGNIYITGSFQGDLNLCGTPLSSQKRDVFLAKFEDQGTQSKCVWAMRYGGAKDDAVLDLAVHGDHIYLAGYFTDTPSPLARTSSEGSPHQPTARISSSPS